MPVSSMIVRTEKQRTREVAEGLRAWEEVSVSEVHGVNLVVVTETPTQDLDSSLWERIEAMAGVLHCDLIYHNFEDEEGPCHDHTS
jgi:nitrate reductase NapAB chaperone NapD